MAVTQSHKRDRTLRREAGSGARSWWRTELLAMGAVTLLILAGLAQVYAHRVSRLEAPSGPPIALTGVRQAEDLMPALQPVFADPADQRFAARWLWEYLSRDDGPGRIDHVGALSAARLPVSAIQTTPDLLEYPRMLERLKGARVARGLEPPVELPVLTTRQLQKLKPGVTVRTLETFRARLVLAAAALLLGLFLPLVAWRLGRRRPDPWLLPITSVLSGLGMILMISLRDPLRDQLLFLDFALGVLGGGLLMAIASLLDLQAGPLRRLRFVPLLAALGVSAVVVVFGRGPQGSDARVNLVLGPVTLQPVELVKLLVVLFLAGYLSRRWEFLRSLHQQSERMPKFFRWLELPRGRDVLPVAVGMGASIGFLFIQRDLGPALVLAWTFLGLYAVARGRAGLPALGTALFAAGCWAAYRLEYPETVYRRIAMWLDNWDNLVRGGEQLAMGLWAVAAGGVHGIGLGYGETVRVPAAHTDFILAAVAEELGFVGLAAVLLLYAVLVWRGLRIALRSRSEYVFFLAVGLTLLLAAQGVLILGGVLGVLPLSGVTTPLLSYGKSSQWCVFWILGILASLSVAGTEAGEGSRDDEVPAPIRPFVRPLRAGAAFGALVLTVLLARAAWLQLFQADEIMVRPVLAVQAEGEVGYVPNPRLKAIADSIPRGTLFDRNGIPLATSDRELLTAHQRELEALHVDLDQVCPEAAGRCYPLGGATFHLLGDLREPVNWAAPNTRFMEKEADIRLQGYDDHATVVDVPLPGGGVSRELRRDYRELLPVWWTRRDPEEPAVKQLLERDRNVYLSIDARLQARVADILESGLKNARQKVREWRLGIDVPHLERAAAVVIDARTGELLASVSYPFPTRIGAALRRLPEDAPELQDRARFGVYPPGSTFKLVTAIAALRKDPALAGVTYRCERLEDGRTGFKMPGRRVIRDDVLDRVPHGDVDLAKGIKVSCNAYFAQLAVQAVKADALFQTAGLFGIRAAMPNTVDELKKALDQSGFGQGEVLATPLQVATVAATIANAGHRVRPTLLADDAIGRGAPGQGEAVLPEAQAQVLADAMRQVVTDGTGRRALLREDLPSVAGKTGTAEVDGKPSHAWFAGFAPYSDGTTGPSILQRQIAVAVLVENAGYGGLFAAPLAAEIIKAASELNLISGPLRSADAHIPPLSPSRLSGKVSGRSAEPHPPAPTPLRGGGRDAEGVGGRGPRSRVRDLSRVPPG